MPARISKSFALTSSHCAADNGRCTHDICRFFLRGSSSRLNAAGFLAGRKEDCRRGGGCQVFAESCQSSFKMSPVSPRLKCPLFSLYLRPLEVGSSDLGSCSSRRDRRRSRTCSMADWIVVPLLFFY